MEISEINLISNSIDELKKSDYNFIYKEEDIENSNRRLKNVELYDILGNIIVIFSEAIEQKILFSISKYSINRINSNQADVINTFKTLSTSIQQKHFINIETFTLEIQGYIFQKGLNYLLIKGEDKSALEDIKKLKVENNTLRTQLNETVQKATNLLTLLESSQNALTTFQKQKEADLLKISQNLEATSSTKRQIDTTQEAINSQKQSIDTIYNELTTKFEKYKEEITNYGKEYSSIANNAKDKNEQLQSFIESNDDIKKSIEKLHNSAIETEKELQKLLTPAIAENLLTTFKKRKMWLFWSKIVWAVATFVTLYFFSTYAISMFEAKEFSFEPLKIFVSTVKLLPLVIILYFSMRQFSKDRNLEEEYAFREVIATSLMSYAEQIKNDSKNELIKETVTKLYISPTETQIRKREINNSVFEKGLEQISNGMKEVKELISKEK